MVIRRGASKPPPPREPALIDTNPQLGITRLRTRLDGLANLDPQKPDDPNFEISEQAIRGAIKAAFGEESEQYGAHFMLEIDASRETAFRSHYDEDDDAFYGVGKPSAKRVENRRRGIERTKAILEGLTKLIEERVAENKQHEGVGDMGSPLDSLAKDRISLVKANGQTVSVGVRASVQPGKILLSHESFPVEPGDIIVREMRQGVPPELYEVIDPHYFNAGSLSRWEITVRRAGSHAGSPSHPNTQVINNHYTINGPAAAVGHGATAVDNTLIQHNNQQTLNYEQLGPDLATIKKALMAEANENEDDHDAIDEASKIGKVQKAIKDGDKSRVIEIVKSLGMKTWDLGEKLLLAYVNHKLRDQLHLPPGEP